MVERADELRELAIKHKQISAGVTYSTSADC